MKRYVLTIVVILVLALLPGTAGAGAGSPANDAAAVQTVTSASSQAPMSSQTSDQLSEQYQVYTIKRGDCLTSIGKQFGVPWRDIAKLNGIKGPKYTIIVGHTLIIPLKPDLPVPTGTAGNYLILCETEAQKQCLNEFAAFKRLNGFTVTIKSVKADVKPAANADPCEAIRQYLKKMDQKLSLEYVLLVGNPYNEDSRCPQHTGGVIPMRYLYGVSTNHKTGYTGSWFDYQDQSNNAFNTPTDIYYAFDFNWDYDGDGYAGEEDEVAESVKQSEPELLFLLGRIPFSDTKDIGTMLNATMQYEQSQKAHSDALIGSLGDWVFFGDALAKNLTEAEMETTTIYDDTDAEYFKFESTYPLSGDNFNQEINKEYDFVYTNNDIAFYNFELVPDKGVQIGLYFMDDTLAMLVETGRDKVRIQNFLANGTVSASIAITRDIGFNPKNPAPRMASLLFKNKSLCVSREFYDAELFMIVNNNVLESYIYCYLGDPSLSLKP